MDPRQTQTPRQTMKSNTGGAPQDGCWGLDPSDCYRKAQAPESFTPRAPDSCANSRGSPACANNRAPSARTQDGTQYRSAPQDCSRKSQAPESYGRAYGAPPTGRAQYDTQYNTAGGASTGRAQYDTQGAPQDCGLDPTNCYRKNQAQYDTQYSTEAGAQTGRAQYDTQYNTAGGASTGKAQYDTQYNTAGGASTGKAQYDAQGARQNCGLDPTNCY